MNEHATTPPRAGFESPLRLRRRIGARVHHVRRLARPYKIEIKRFSKFMVVGAIGFVVDFGVYNLLLLAIPGRPITPPVAGTVSLVCAICSNFSFNHFWVYPDAHGRSILLQFVQFFLVSITVAIMRVPLIGITHGPFGDLAGMLLGLDAHTAEVMGNNLALILTVIIGLFWNFFVNRFWTYRHAPRV
jgi:putative flippase GtrA